MKVKAHVFFLTLWSHPYMAAWLLVDEYGHHGHWSASVGERNTTSTTKSNLRRVLKSTKRSAENIKTTSNMESGRSEPNDH